MEDINWFFFDYFILRYVEVMEYKSSDGTPCTSPKSLSLVIPTGISTSVYVEVIYLMCDTVCSLYKLIFRSLLSNFMDV